MPPAFTCFRFPRERLTSQREFGGRHDEFSFTAADDAAPVAVHVNDTAHVNTRLNAVARAHTIAVLPALARTMVTPGSRLCGHLFPGKFFRPSRAPSRVARRRLRFRIAVAEHLVGERLNSRARAALFERVTTEAMSERHRGHAPHVLARHLAAPFKRRECARRARDRYLAAMTVNAEPHTEFGYPVKDGARDLDAREFSGGAHDALAQPRLRGLLRGVEGGGVCVESLSMLDDEDAAFEVADCLDFDAEAEAVEQLWPQLTLLRVAGTDEDKA
jgi:hypothetical protein